MLLTSCICWLQKDRIVERDEETHLGVQLLVATAHGVPKLDENNSSLSLSSSKLYQGIADRLKYKSRWFGWCAGIKH
jgi:hypothetical protein